MRKQISIAMALATVMLIGHMAPTAIAGVGADVSVSASLDPSQVELGEPTQLTVTVTNEGDTAAANVQLTTQLPDGLDLSDVVPSIGTCDGILSVVCDLGTLGPGDVETVVLDLIPTEIGDLDLTPTVTSLLDTDTTNNAAPTVLRVVRATRAPEPADVRSAARPGTTGCAGRGVGTSSAGVAGTIGSAGSAGTTS